MRCSEHLNTARNLFLSLLFLGTIGACSGASDFGSVAKLRWLERADPIADAQRSLSIE
jgi:hypothetical protein